MLQLMRFWTPSLIALTLAWHTHARRLHTSALNAYSSESSRSLSKSKSHEQASFKGRLNAMEPLAMLFMAFNPFTPVYKLVIQPLRLDDTQMGKVKKSASTNRPAKNKGTSPAKKDTLAKRQRLEPAAQSPTRTVPEEIQLPDYALDGIPKPKPELPWIIEEKSAEDIEGMRRAGRVAREVLDAAVKAVAVGVTTDAIDAVVHDETIARGAYPSPLNYHGFPKSCCTSVNEVICHGIPDARKLQDGDIINIDITCYVGGYHGDCSEMVLVGNVDEKGKKLVKVTYDAWQAAIAYCKPGQPYSGIGAVIEDYIMEHGYQSSAHFSGHGIGKSFHMNPNVMHTRNNEAANMAVGHTFTIEPMICEGSSSHTEWSDRWTAVTIDGGRSAQFEHTFLVTPDGLEALTARLPTSKRYWWEEENREDKENKENKKNEKVCLYVDIDY